GGRDAGFAQTAIDEEQELMLLSRQHSSLSITVTARAPAKGLEQNLNIRFCSSLVPLARQAWTSGRLGTASRRSQMPSAPPASGMNSTVLPARAGGAWGGRTTRQSARARVHSMALS